MNNTIDRTLILIRHAHRDKERGQAFDKGLSQKGRNQAKAISAFCRRRFPVDPLRLLSSPKKRCVETLVPLSKKIGEEIEPHSFLDEGGDLQAKIEDFLSYWRGFDEVCVVCTHGDWIPQFMRSKLGIEIEVCKGGWIEIEENRGRFELRWLVQKPKLLN